MGAKKEDDPYILASQATKVFYIKGAKDGDWNVVKHVKVRDAFDMSSMNVMELSQVDMPSNWVRKDIVDDMINVDPVRELQDERNRENEL